MTELTKEEIAYLTHGECPDCGGVELLPGPIGGIAQNFKCADPDCGSRYNISRIGDRSGNIWFAERL